MSRFCVRCGKPSDGEYCDNCKRIMGLDDRVSAEAYKQVMWERDTAIAQLKELGYEFGEKIRTDDDCISRASLIEHLDNVCYNPDTPWGIAQKAYINCFKAFINREPTFRPTERTGHWLHVGVEILGGADVYRCSECDRKSHGGNFCKHCGAKMVEPQESEDKDVFNT